MSLLCSAEIAVPAHTADSLSSLSIQSACIRSGLMKAGLLSILLGWAGSSSALLDGSGSGTLSDTAQQLIFSGQTPAGVNPAGTTGVYPCVTGVAECDSYSLNVNLPEGFATGHPGLKVRVTLDWEFDADNYDLYVSDAASGNLTGSAATAAGKPEVVEFVPVDGVTAYYVDIVPYTAYMNNYSGVIQLIGGGTGGGGDPGSGGGSAADDVGACISSSARVVCAGAADPAYGVYPVPTEINDALLGAGEPTLDINYLTGSVFLRFSFGTAKATFDASGAHWTNVSDLYSTVGLDPFLTAGYPVKANGIPDATKPSRIFTMQLIGAGSAMAYSDDDGVSWLPADAGGIPQGPDNQSVAAGPYPKGSPLALNPAFPYAVYYCSHAAVNAFCSRSDTGGMTFNPSSPIFPAEQLCGNHGHVKVGADGTVYVPMNNPCLLPLLIGGEVGEGLAFSTDAGLTWHYQLVPNTSGGRWDPSIAIARDGATLYYAYAEQDDALGDRQRVIKGTLVKGPGVTAGCSPTPCIAWDAASDVDLATPVGLRNTVFSTVVAGDADRATVIFHGTTRGGASGDRAAMGSADDDATAAKAANNAIWHLWAASTLDGGAHWAVRNMTPNDPTQRGSVCDQGTTCSSSPNERNMLDFMDAVLDAQGNVVMSFADGCTGNCVNRTGPANFSDLGTIVRQTGGPKMYADPNAPMSPPPGPVVNLSRTTVNFSDQRVGTASNAQTVLLTNSGTAGLKILKITGTVINFSQTNDCPSSLAAGSSCAINVTFKPVAAGSAAGQLTIASDASSSPNTVSLSGSGIP